MKKIFAALMILSVTLSWSQENVKRPAILGIAHMAFFVGDLQTARTFYKDYLGFEEPYLLKQKDGTERTAIIKINDLQYIELTTGEAASDGRLNHIAFYTDDIKKMLDYLSEKGVKVPGKIDKGRAGNLSFNISDPDGHVIEIVQYEPESWTTREKGKFMPDTRPGIRIEHIGITSAGEDVSRKFYCEILGFKKGNKPQVPEGNERIEFGIYNKLPDAEFRGIRNHLCLMASPGVEKVVENLKEKKSLIKIETHSDKKNKLYADVCDDYGTRIEFIDEIN
jgi:lactoylglutathione lyase